MQTELMIPNYVTPSLNDSIKEHYRYKTINRKKLEKIIWASTRNRHQGPVRMEVYRHSSGTLDEENFVGGTKVLTDAIKNMGVIKDDTTAIIQQSHYEQVKISRKGPKMMVVIITDL